MKKIPYIDLHCDTLSAAYWKARTDVINFPEAMVDVRRLKAGGCQVQCFAIYMPDADLREKMGGEFPGDRAYIQALSDILHNTVSRCPGELDLVERAADLRKNADAGKLSAIMTIEDGRGADGKLESFQTWYDLGVRLVSLTWNHPNCIGWPHSENPEEMKRGLTPFGREAVAQMNKLGMTVDVSHLSDGGFWDVAEISGKPFVASHSNCRAVTPHSRNLTDGMIRALADHGGVAGLNFCPRFLDGGKKPVSSLEAMTAHLRHLVNVGGISCAALGSDLDGIHGELAIGSCDQMQLLFQALAKAGFTEDEIERIAWKNARRVLEDVLR